MLQEHRSRPLWARELKLSRRLVSLKLHRSRPLWARELKQEAGVKIDVGDTVAPLVGA